MVLLLIIILAKEICSRQSTKTDHDPDPSLSLAHRFTAKADRQKITRGHVISFFFWHGCHGVTRVDMSVRSGETLECPQVFRGIFHTMLCQIARVIWK